MKKALITRVVYVVIMAVGVSCAYVSLKNKNGAIVYAHDTMTEIASTIDSGHLSSAAGDYVKQDQSTEQKRVLSQNDQQLDIQQSGAQVSAQGWRMVQEQAKNTVVQIISHIAAIDLLRPYRAPTEGTGSGSGFFIKDEGGKYYIVTNAHVVDQAKAIWLQIPSFGKRIFDVDMDKVSISPDRDLALLQLRPELLALIEQKLGTIPFLPLGNSDTVLRSDEVLALGYPLGQQSLKSTNGIVSGREYNMIQMSNAINPGSSGGALLNTRGEVIGISTAGIVEAQNIGYAIAVNDLKIVLPDMKKTRIVRKPFLGVLFNNASVALTEFLGNPAPGGCYVVEVVKGSTLEKAGVKQGDMIYAINGFDIDIFGDMCVPWCEDKISLIEYVSRLSIGESINLVVYRSGERKEFSVKFDHAELPAIRKIYPGYDAIDYEIFAGMVIMPLTLNHVQLIGPQAPGLAHFTEMRNTTKPTLVITHMFRDSQVFRDRITGVGFTVHEVNGMPVGTLDDFRKAVKKGMGNKFFTMLVSDNVNRTTDRVFLSLSMKQILEEEPRLSVAYCYPITQHTKELLSIAQAQNMLAVSQQARTTA